MDNIIQKVKIIKVGQNSQIVEDRVAIDAKIELEVNGGKIGEFYLSPMDLEDFTFGYLRDGLYIKSKDEVENIEVDKSVIKVTLSPEKTVVEGNIGCYDGWRDREQEITRVESDFKVDRKEIFDS
ncbi:MAG TPA: formate dehydrogenase accessory sulfurtransferase FdhD, partial [Methanobacteriaceae archaeon]|nr:formate dehydrogenase accessory sulfurtransferase FdhD [Methanobacteriaceae archaeon]